MMAPRKIEDERTHDAQHAAFCHFERELLTQRKGNDMESIGGTPMINNYDVAEKPLSRANIWRPAGVFRPPRMRNPAASNGSS